jgi:hypothetical protein
MAAAPLDKLDHWYEPSTAHFDSFSEARRRFVARVRHVEQVALAQVVLTPVLLSASCSTTVETRGAACRDRASV